MRASFKLSTPVAQSPRVLQCSGMFDLPAADRSEIEVEAELPVEDRPWNVGLIVGPSGCGKSTLAARLWPREFGHELKWPKAASVIDAFPRKLGIKEIMALMSSVGFSSPPAWLRPFHVLSNGERFRVTMARLLAELPALAVVDEFTSVVDRTVAQLGSAALAKTVRRRKQKLVAVTCHDDVERWLQPDWVYRPAEHRFTRRSPRRRPPIDLVVNRVHHSAWHLFKPHHYLTGSHSPSAVSFVATWRGTPVAWSSWLPFVGRTRDGRTIRRSHRLVCLPDYQGVGIGAELRRFLASMWAGLGCRAMHASAHPADVASLSRSDDFVLRRAPGLNSSGGSDRALTARFNRTRAALRLIASFEYVGPPMDEGRARDVLNTWANVVGAPEPPAIPRDR